MRYWDCIVSKEYLRSVPNTVFVFGDNTIHRGKGGAAALRDEPNSIGFITKKYPNNRPESFYTVEEYRPVFDREIRILMRMITDSPDKKFLISPIGSGLANKHNIWELVIRDSLMDLLGGFPNVIFMWEENWK